MSLTFYIREENNDSFDKRIAMIRAIGSRLDKCTQSAIQSEVRWIAMLSPIKPDEWTLSHLDEVIQATRKIAEAGL